MNPNDPELRREISRAICCVQLNGGDPNQPAMRWNGFQMEPQDFPAWYDYQAEACAAIHAFFSYENRIRAIENREAERLADAREA